MMSDPGGGEGGVGGGGFYELDVRWSCGVFKDSLMQMQR